jgi:competence protein ComEC
LSVIGLRPRALNVLSATAVVLVAADPLVVVDAGAWLSFGATLGILLGARQFVAWAVAGNDAAPVHPGAAPVHILRRVWLGGLGLLAATVAAELTLLPVSAALFARVGVLGLVLNFVAIPSMAIVQLAGIAMTACAGWWESGAAVFGRLAALAATWLIDSSAAVDAAPWLVWRVPPVSIVWSALCYAGLVGIVTLRPRTTMKRLAAVAVVASVAVIVTAPAVSMAAPRGGRFRLTMIDVGQGDAIAAQFPGGHSLLIDAGGAPGSSFDVGERVVTPALWALGIRRLDWLAVTHADVDHAGGVASVARNLRPRELWEGVPVPAHAGMHVLRDAAHRERRAWRQLLAGHRLELGGAVLEVLHPPAPDWERRRVRNDDSLVFRIRFGRVDMLLTGDAGAEFENAFVDGEPPALLRLLKVGHHGSRTSTSARLVDTFAPHLALISAGRGNTFGHPTRDVLSRLDARGAIILRTDLDGAITIETDGATIEARTMSGRRWSLSAN